MMIHLPEELRRFVRSQVESGRFASEDEAVAEAVRLAQRREHEQAARAPSPTVPPWERVLENMKDVPDAEFDEIPPDSSEQLDHYLYGTPRRTTS